MVDNTPVPVGTSAASGDQNDCVPVTDKRADLLKQLLGEERDERSDSDINRYYPGEGEYYPSYVMAGTR